jgi:hypothetical protein
VPHNCWRGAQSACLLLLLPLTCAVQGRALFELPAELAAGAACLAGGPGCGGAPALPAAYISVNVAFNVAAMHLVRGEGALVTSLVMSALVPLTVAAFALLPLPLLPRSSLSPGFVPGAALLMLGVLVFNAAAWAPAAVAAARRAAAWWSRLARGDISGDSGSGGSDAPRRLAGS